MFVAGFYMIAHRTLYVFLVMFSCGHVERTSSRRRERLVFSCCHVEEPCFEEEKDFVEVTKLLPVRLQSGVLVVLSGRHH